MPLWLLPVLLCSSVCCSVHPCKTNQIQNEAAQALSVDVATCRAHAHDVCLAGNIAILGRRHTGVPKYVYRTLMGFNYDLVWIKYLHDVDR